MQPEAIATIPAVIEMYACKSDVTIVIAADIRDIVDPIVPAV
ncbi:hypothetical protein SAMN04488524_0554 [Pedobacter africanus]|uniref:Uncharacterized protein n=1 Tax=Pedobacter africanus TaxID=151894 RepID=A0A1W1ZB38_9SPHI|nr:hypothetical protein SAMN04488524_0554 [Pedobacter africanus]